MASPPNRFQGIVAILSIILLTFICLIFAFIAAKYNNEFISVYIVMFIAILGPIGTLIIWIVDKNFDGVDKWFKDRDEDLVRLWGKLTKSRPQLAIPTGKVPLPIIIASLSNMLLLLVVLMFIIFPTIPNTFHTWITKTTPIAGCGNGQRSGICVRTIAGQPIGISDGQYRFWPEQVHDSINAEDAIYTENKHLTEKGANGHFITIVFISTLSPSGRDAGAGHNDLQANYLLQEKANNELAQQDQCFIRDNSGCLNVRLLIANAGTNMAYATVIAQQIETIATHDKSFIGVTGWPISVPAGTEALRMLDAHKIVVVSSTASSDALTAISRYFFRVAPVDSQQGPAGAQYAQTTFPMAHTAAIFYAADNPYSLTLATSFAQAFLTDNTKHVLFEPYQYQQDINTKENVLNKNLTDVLTRTDSADLIYFAGYSDDLSRLQNALHTQEQASGVIVPVLSGDAAYNISGFKGSGYKNLAFTGFASPDEWGNFSDPCNITTPSVPQRVADFFCGYKQAFDPNNLHPGTYGWSRADSDIIMAYDAITMLVNGYVAAQLKNPTPTEDDIQQALTGFNLCNPQQGVSGSITFGPDGNPINKAIVILTVNNQALTSYVGLVQGSLVATKPTWCTGNS